MFKPEMSLWQGRDDTVQEGPEALRWHQQVQPWVENVIPGTAFLGFACDEGVRRNQGRVGTAAAPIVLRRTLSHFAWHQRGMVYDCGDIACTSGDLESAQKTLSNRVTHLLQTQHKPLIVGGGHETAWGTFRGLAQALAARTIGIINIDAHFDLRQSNQPHSGTAFAQMAQWCGENNRPFYYLCLGVAESANTLALFDRSTEFQVRYIPDSELGPWHLDAVLPKVHEFIKQVDVVYLSIDLDVLPIQVMPAVSAPAALGVPLETIDRLVVEISQTRKLAVADVVEFNPSLDQDGRSAKVAARVVWQLARYWNRTPLIKRSI